MMAEPRQKKRQRQTLVCDFCRKRKVKCDKGNPCSTCIKYGNKNCHYSDNVFQMVSGNEFVEQSNHGENFGSKTSPNDTLKRKASDSSMKSDLELELEQLKQKIRNIEQSVTSIATSDISPSSLNGNNAQTHFALSSTENVAPTHVDPNSPGNKRRNSMFGRNPVASNYDTINFYTGYTPIQDKEPLRRANYGPMSWITLLRKDRGLNMLWQYLDGRRKLLEDKLKVFQTTNASTKTEHYFKNILTESFGYNDVKLYKSDSGDNNKESDAPPTGIDIIGQASPDQIQSASGKSDVNSKTRLFHTTFKANQSATKSKINERARSLGISFYAGEIDSELALCDRIELMLPNESVIWLLVDRFFSHIYPFYPAIDEVDFRANISAIIGLEGYDNKKRVTINVEKKLDFAHLGLLLLMLRFSYLSLLSAIESVNEKNLNTTDQSPKAQRLKFLLNNPINLDIVDCAQECLNQFNLLRRVNMTIMQLALFTRLYHMYAPEDGDGVDGGDSPVFTATLVQMALLLGLNREPDLFPDACNDEKVNNIGRKIWYLLLIFDFNNAMALGTPLNIQRSMFDTKFPFYKQGNSNIIDTDLEMKILSTSFPRVDRVYGPMYDIITTVLDVRGNINMAQFAEKLNFVETYFSQEYAGISSIFNEVNTEDDELDDNDGEPPFVNTLKMKIYFASHFFLVTIYFHFFCYYENKKNSEYAFCYLKKICSIIIGEIMPYYLELLENNPRIFKNLTDMIVTPSFEVILHKSFIICNAILIRIRHTLFTLKTDPKHDFYLVNDPKYVAIFSKLTRMDQLLLKSCKIFIETVGRLSKRYYYAWRISKAGTFVHELIKGKEFYEHTAKSSSESSNIDGSDPAKKPNLLDLRFSNEMLDELIAVFEEPLSRIPKHTKKNQNNENDQQQHRQHQQGQYTQQHLYNGIQTHNANDTNFVNGVPQRPALSTLNNDGSGFGGEPHSVGSTGSSSYSENLSVSNESVDRLWLHMLQLKGKDINNNNLGIPQSFDNINATPVDNLVNQVETPGSFLRGFNGELVNDIGTGTGADNDLNVVDHSLNELLRTSELDIFQSLSFEDIWGKNSST